MDELFSSSTASQFTQMSLPAQTAVYTPEIFLTLSRFSSSRLYDLVLPSALELSLNRELRREGVLVGSRNNYRLALQSRALNLFGALGAYPLFPFYRTDEASGSLQITATQAEGVTEKLSLLAGQFLACDGENSRLTLENRFTYTYEESGVWSDSVGALFSWERHPAGGVRVPLLPAETGARGYLEPRGKPVRHRGRRPARRRCLAAPLQFRAGPPELPGPAGFRVPKRRDFPGFGCRRCKRRGDLLAHRPESHAGGPDPVLRRHWNPGNSDYI